MLGELDSRWLGAGLMGLGAFSWGLVPAALASGIAVLAHDIVGWSLFHRAFDRRQFRRALWLGQRLDRAAWIPGARDVCRINLITCHIVLGELDRAKELARSVPREHLSPRSRAALEVNLAALYVRMMAPDSALALLDDVKVEALPPGWRPYLVYHRACAHALGDHFAKVRELLASIAKDVTGSELEAPCLSLAAWADLEEGRLDRAVSRSNEAVRRLGDGHRGRQIVLVNHARVVLEASGDTRDALDTLAPVMDHESELWVSVRAEFHNLLARCYLASGMAADAAAHVERAAVLPAPASLRARIRRVAAETHIASARAFA
jgi:tetratricopeptide (TPR) repeat protein